MKIFKRILFATDLTPASSPAFGEAVALAIESNAELIVAHAYEPPNVTQAAAVGPDVYDEWDRNLRNEAEERIAPLVQHAKNAGAKAWSLVLGGTAGDVIIEGAKENGVDLVVMGTHGRKGVSRMFLGSVASHVISTAPCPVMTVRAA
jgi:nucleotide-binding universal stress UspA family protein